MTGAEPGGPGPTGRHPLPLGLAADALVAARMGVWGWDVGSGAVVWDDQISRLHGLDPDDAQGTFAEFLSNVHDEDRATVEAEVQDALTNGRPFLSEFRVLRRDGTTAWVQLRGRAVHDADGTPVGMRGIGLDTTQARTAREQLGRTLEHISDGVLFLDATWMIVYANARAARLLHRQVDELVGRPVRSEFPDVVGTEFWTGFRAAVRTGETQTFEAYYGPLDGWFEVRVFPAPTGLTVYFQDVNERRIRAAAQEMLVAQLEEALRRQADTQALVAALAESLTVDEIAAVVLDQAHRTLGTIFAGVALLDDDGRALRFVTLEPLPAETEAEWAEVPLKVASALTDAVRMRRPIFHGSQTVLLEEYPHLAGTVEIAQNHAFASVPMEAGRQVIGALSMSWSEERDFTEEDQAFMRTLAAQCAQAIERAQLLARQVDVADALQRAMLPDELPMLDGLEVSACYIPATTDLTIGGDWYDAFELGDGRIAFAVGDVSGHGLPAAGVMGRIRNGLRAYLIDRHGPAASLEKLDTMVGLDGHGLFATVVVAVYEPATGELVWSNAGHPPPLIRGAGKARFLEGHVGAPVGVGGQGGHREQRVVLDQGHSLIAFTDGLVERRRENLDEGFARLLEAVAVEGLDLTSAGCEALVHHLTEGGSRDDDICVLMVHRLR